MHFFLWQYLYKYSTCAVYHTITYFNVSSINCCSRAVHLAAFRCYEVVVFSKVGVQQRSSGRPIRVSVATAHATSSASWDEQWDRQFLWLPCPLYGQTPPSRQQAPLPCRGAHYSWYATDKCLFWANSFSSRKRMFQLCLVVFRENNRNKANVGPDSVVLDEPCVTFMTQMTQ